MRIPHLSRYGATSSNSMKLTTKSRGSAELACRIVLLELSMRQTSLARMGRTSAATSSDVSALSNNSHRSGSALVSRDSLAACKNANQFPNSTFNVECHPESQELALDSASEYSKGRLLAFKGFRIAKASKIRKFLSQWNAARLVQTSLKLRTWRHDNDRRFWPI